MDQFAIVIAVISLALAGIAYWRAGGQRDVAVARERIAHELAAIRAKQKEFDEAFLVAVEEAYAQNRQTLQQTAEGLRQLQDQAIAGLADPINRAMEQLHALEQQLAAGLKSARASTLATAQSVEVLLRRRVHRLEARGSVLYAKAEAVLADNWAQKQEFQVAEKRLDEATVLLALARETLRGDYAYYEQFEIVKRALTEATAGVRAAAPAARPRIAHVVAETDALLGALERDEQQAADTNTTCARGPG